MNEQQLDFTFSALADSTRRSILIQLSNGEANVSALAEPHEMSQPAISKHLKVLEKAGLIERHKRGREQWVRVKPEVAQQAADWINFYAKIWVAQFDAVDDYLKQKQSSQRNKKS